MSNVKEAFQKVTETKKVPGVGAIALDIHGNELFKAAYGTTNIDDDSAPAFQTDTCLLIFSLTKLVTSVAGLQLLEQGKINLHDPVEQYVPSIKDAQVLDSFDNQNKPIMKNPAQKPKIINLFTHTTGMSYDFMEQSCLKWRLGVGLEPTMFTRSTLSQFKHPFLFEPGAGFRYGNSTDFLGLVVEAVSGLRLDRYFQEHIFEPLGMKNSGLKTPAGKPFLNTHMRGKDGNLTPASGFRFPYDAEVVAGGHFLTSTLDDYSQLLLAVINNGTHPKTNGKILEETTVKEYLFKDMLPQICSTKEVGYIRSSVPQVTNEALFLPGIPKGWSCGFMINLEDTPNGRSSGSGSWAGLGNLYYWLDPKNGKLGLLGSSILPFMDVTMLHLFDVFEKSVYGVGDPKKADQNVDPNFVVCKAIDGISSSL